ASLRSTLPLSGYAMAALAIPGDVPAILTAYGAWPNTSPCDFTGNSIFWLEGDRVRSYEFPVADRSRVSFGSGAIPLAAQEEIRDGAVELGVVYTSNGCGNARSEIYRLLRLESGEWEPIWDAV